MTWVLRVTDAAATGSPLVWTEETAKLDLSAYHTAWIINGVVYLAAGISDDSDLPQTNERTNDFCRFKNYF